MLFDLIYRYGSFDAYRIFIYCLFTFEYQKGLPAKAESPELSMVDGRRIELLTSSVSRKRSTSELIVRDLTGRNSTVESLFCQHPAPQIVIALLIAKVTESPK